MSSSVSVSKCISRNLTKQFLIERENCKSNRSRLSVGVKELFGVSVDMDCPDPPGWVDIVKDISQTFEVIRNKCMEFGKGGG